MGVIFDTSLLIAAERGRVDVRSLLEAHRTERIGVAAITAAELLHGCHRATDAAVRARRAAFVEALLDAMPVLPFGLAEARRHAELWATLARDGSLIGPHDLIIGATALALGWSLATLNTGEFSRVRGLRLAPVEAYLS
jgi:predicted nucleic acid-binding protein